MLMRMDMAALGRLVGEIADVPAPTASGPTNFVMGAGVRDRDWRFLLRFDLGFLKAASGR
jgi:hypothetical protein